MSKCFTIAALLTSLTLGGCLGGTSGSELVDLSAYQRGKHHFNAGRFGLAVSHFQSALRRAPNSIETLNGLAASYDRLGRFDLSARYYERALVANPESGQTLNNIGYSYLLQERFDLAVAYLRDAHSRDNEDPVVLANRNTAEVSYQDADLKRSAEEARTEIQTAPASTQVRPQVAARPLASSAPDPLSRRVKPWIERTAPRVQSLITRPQVALLGAIEEGGINPQIAAYRPHQPKAAEQLPDFATAPMTLDLQVSTERSAAILQEARSAPDQPRNIPVAGSAPTPVTVASLDPLSTFEGVSPEVSGDANGGLVTDRVGDAAPTPVTIASLDPLSIFEGVSAEGSRGANGGLVTDPVVDAAPIEVTVASLDGSRDLSDAAPGLGQAARVGTTEPIAPGVVLSALDPLDALEDDVLEAEDASPQEGIAEMDLTPEVAEIQVATLGATVSDAPRTDTQPAIAIVGSLPLVEVSNGTGRLNMAARIRDYLGAKGIVVKRLTNAEDFRHRETVIYYRAGWRAYAEKLARMLPAVIDLDGHPGQESDIRLELGGDLLDFDRGLYYAVKRTNDANRG